jgi:hypothetical protein
MKTQEIDLSNKETTAEIPKSSTQRPIFIASEQLFSSAKTKSIMLGFLIGFFLPVVFLEFLNFPHSREYLLRFLLGAFILMPILAYLLYMFMQNYFKCPQCESLWAFQKIGETIIETTITPGVNSKNEKVNIKQEKYLDEFECSRCHYKNFTHKKRKFIDMSK